MVPVSDRASFFPRSYEAAALRHLGCSHKHKFLLEDSFVSVNDQCENFVSELRRTNCEPLLSSLDELETLALYLAFDKDGDVTDLIERFSLKDNICNDMVQLIANRTLVSKGGANVTLSLDIGNLQVLLAIHNWAMLIEADNYPLIGCICNELTKCCRRNFSPCSKSRVEPISELKLIRDLLLEAVRPHDLSSWSCLVLKQLLENCGNDMHSIIEEIKIFVLAEMECLSSQSLYLISQLMEVTTLREELRKLDLDPLLRKIKNLKDLPSAYSACSILCQIITDREDISIVIQHVMLTLGSVPVLMSSEELAACWPVMSSLEAIISLSRAKATTTINSSILVAYFACRLIQDANTEFAKSEAQSVVNVIMERISLSLNDAEISAGIESFLASMPSLEERKSFYEAFGCIMSYSSSMSAQNFWSLWDQANETNESSLGLTPAPLDITMSPICKVATDEDTVELLDQTREGDSSLGQVGDQRASTSAVGYLQQTNHDLRANILGVQREMRALEEERARVARMLECKDMLLKDALQRLQMSLVKQEELKDAEQTARSWAEKCENDSLHAQKELESSKVDLLLQNQALREEKLRLEIAYTEMKTSSEQFDAKFKEEKEMNTKLLAQLEVSIADYAELKSQTMKLETQLDFERENARAAEVDVANLKKHVESLESDLAVEKDRTDAQKQRLLKVEKESSKHQEILRYINKMTMGGDTSFAVPNERVQGDGKENSCGHLNERRMSSIHETLERHLSQPLDEI